MYVVHCGGVLDVSESRELKPTQEEAQRGVVSVLAQAYNCPKPECQKKLYTKQELFEVGSGPIVRIKKNVASFIARFNLARKSDWVWGYHPETFAKVKRTVR